MDREQKITLVATGTMALAASIAFVLAMTTESPAHSWYTKTSDPLTGFGCCGGEDCAEISDTDVREVQGGYVFLPTSEFIPTSRVQKSRDWRFHRCIYLQAFSHEGQAYEKGATRCFFAPPGSM